MKRQHEDDVVRLVCVNERHNFSKDYPVEFLPKMLEQLFRELPTGEMQRPSFVELLDLLDRDSVSDLVEESFRVGRPVPGLGDVFRSCVEAVLSMAAGDAVIEDFLTVAEDRLQISLDTIPIIAKLNPYKKGVQPVPKWTVDVSDLV